MSTEADRATGDWQLDEIDIASCTEWHFADAPAEDALDPGFASDDGRRRQLYFERGYLLDINGDGKPPPAMSRANVTRVDVTGKWRGFSVSGAGSAEVLAAGANIERALEGRSCAALRLFDCPTIVVRTASGLEIFIQRSYVASATAALSIEGLR